MIEAETPAPTCRTRTSPFSQLDEDSFVAVCSERCLAARVTDDAEPEDVLIKRERSLEIGNLQTDLPELCCLGKAESARPLPVCIRCGWLRFQCRAENPVCRDSHGVPLPI